MHYAIKNVAADIPAFSFNTAVARLMELVNALYLLERPGKDNRVGLSVVREAIEAVVLMLAPIVPHFAQELWSMLGGKGILFHAAWPVWDDGVASEEQMTIVVQVNGKVRGKMLIPVDETAEKIQALALADEKVSRFIEGKRIVKQVYVPGRLVNIVVQG